MLGAFVLNAVDEVEHRRIDKHIDTCAECAREVRLLSLPAAELALLAPVEAGDTDLADRISARLPWRPRRALVRATAVVAAAAVIAAGVLGVSLVRSQQREQRLATIVGAADRDVALRARSGFEGSGHLYVRGDDVALVLRGVPDLGGDRVYQLWALAGEQPASMALIGGQGQIVHLFEWNGRAETFAVTIEPAGGSPVPTTEPVLAG